MSHAVRCDNCGIYADLPHPARVGRYIGDSAVPDGWLWVGWHWGTRPQDELGHGGVYCRVACAAAALQREHAPPVEG